MALVRHQVGVGKVAIAVDEQPRGGAQHGRRGQLPAQLLGDRRPRRCPSRCGRATAAGRGRGWRTRAERRGTRARRSGRVAAPRARGASVTGANFTTSDGGRETSSAAPRRPSPHRRDTSRARCRRSRAAHRGRPSTSAVFFRSASVRSIFATSSFGMNGSWSPKKKSSGQVILGGADRAGHRCRRRRTAPPP